MELVEVKEAGGVVVDLTPVVFMGSTGLSVLLAGHRRAQAHGHTIRLVCPEGPVLRVLRLTGMEKVVEGRDGAERVEVARGPFSSLYGGNAMGGVVNLVTKPVSRREFEVIGQ